MVVASSFGLTLGLEFTAQTLMDTQEEGFQHVLGVPATTFLAVTGPAAGLHWADSVDVRRSVWKGLQRSTRAAHGASGVGTVPVPTLGFLFTLCLLPRQPPRLLLSLCPPSPRWAQQKPPLQHPA